MEDAASPYPNPFPVFISPSVLHPVAPDDRAAAAATREHMLERIAADEAALDKFTPSDTYYVGLGLFKNYVAFPDLLYPLARYARP